MLDSNNSKIGFSGLRAACYIFMLIFFPVYLNYRHIFDVRTFTDSPSYLNNSVFVNPTYPFFINILQLICGEENIKAILTLQYVIGFSIFAFAIYKLCRVLNIMLPLEVLLLVFINLVYINTCGANTMTEALAFPLFLLAVTYIVKLITTKQKKYFNLSLLFSALLYLVRPQFISFYCVLLLALLYLSCANRKNWLKLKYFISLLAVVLLTFYTPNIYNQYRYGKFIPAQGSGQIIFLSAAYYLQEDDLKLFRDDKLTSRFINDYYKLAVKYNALKYCDDKKWAKKFDKKDFKPGFSANWEGFYEILISGTEAMVGNTLGGKYNVIRNGDNECVIYDLGHYNNSEGPKTVILFSLFSSYGIEDWMVINPVLMDISKKLIQVHFYDWARTNFLIFLYMGGTLWLVPCLVMLILILFNYKKYNDNAYANLLLVGVILHISNTLIVCFSAPAGMRYVFYTYVLFVAILLLSLQKLYDKIIDPYEKKLRPKS